MIINEKIQFYLNIMKTKIIKMTKLEIRKGLRLAFLILRDAAMSLRS